MKNEMRLAALFSLPLVVTSKKSAWSQCKTEKFHSLEGWTFTRGNGSPNPNDLVDPNPNKPRELAMHLPGWGNLELQNYDDISATTNPKGGLEIKSSVRDINEAELKTGADYLLRAQSFEKVRLQWNNEWGTASYASDKYPDMRFYTNCDDSLSCKKLFVNIGCVDGNLAQCRIAFVHTSWSDSFVLSAHSDSAVDEKSITTAKPFDGTLSSNMLWNFTQVKDGSWTIQSNTDGRFLTTRSNPDDDQYNQLKCNDFMPSSTDDLPAGARWSLQGIFSSRIFSNMDLSRPYKVTGHIQVPAGQGTWPTFWLLPAKKTELNWPENGEIDIFDHVANDGEEMHQVVHVKDFHSGNPKGSITNITGAATRFVTYDVEVFDSELRFSIDGEVTHVYANSGQTGGDNYPFGNSPFNIILNVAVGGWWGGEKGVEFSLSDSTLLVKDVTWCRSYEGTFGQGVNAEL